MQKLNVYFSDWFKVSPVDIEEYGAFNISLINDLPVFIDPFLLFSSDKPEYQELHKKIIDYIKFLRRMSESGQISSGLVKQWFVFPEVKQNWLGFSKVGNSGSGLGRNFAIALNNNLATIFNDFGTEQITKGSHLEKLCLVKDGVGKDNISDFTTNLIKGFLCEYTQKFAQTYIEQSRTKVVNVKHAEFDLNLRVWLSKKYTLPFIDGDYVLLTPKDLLTKDEAWINKHDLIADFDDILASMSNDELRAQINEYFLRMIPEDAKTKEVNEAISGTFRKYPELIDHYIRLKEDTSEQAQSLSNQKVRETEAVFIEQVSKLMEELRHNSAFYTT
jgi:hypothetical protein